MAEVDSDGKAPNGAPYNPIFETFVDPDKPDHEQLSNLVAYSLYKRAKAEWTKGFKVRRGRGPSPDELTAYHETWTSIQIGALRDRAWSSLAAFGESIVEDAKPGILKEALRGTFWPEIWRGVFAAFLYTVLLILAVLVLRWSGIDALSILKKANPKP